MKEQVLSIEQMRKLKKLGIDTSKASMFWNFRQILDYPAEPFEYIETIKLDSNSIPTFTLQDILTLLESDHRLMVIKHEPNEWMDSAFELLKFQYKDKNN